MRSEEFAMNDFSGVYSSERIVTKAGKEAAKAKRSRAAHCALWSLITAAGAGSFSFGFWLLAEREKDLGFIDVLIAFAVIAGVALMGAGIAALVRTVKERRGAAK